jgi:isoleucyl-tRNA synthetase
MRFVGQAIAKFGQEEIAQIEKDGKISVDVNGNMHDLLLEEVEISTKDSEGWTVSTYNGLTVALDITISEELKNEGIARELVNRIQNLRKDSGFEVTDMIKVEIEYTPALENAVNSNSTYIKNETLTKELNFVETLEKGFDIEFDEYKTKINLTLV